MSSPIPAPIRCGDLVMRFDRRAYLMGVVNITPDSFSEGGRFMEPKAAVDHALAMAEAGADIIDVGGESTRPGAEAVPVEEEIRRVVPVVEGIARFCTAPVSIDTTKAAVAGAAIEAGASVINDVSACRFDADMAPLAAKTGAPLVLMHMRGEPGTMQAGEIHYDDLMGEIGGYLKRATSRAVEAGVNRENIIWDPGIGFGKTAQHNLIILNRLGELSNSGHALLVGPSRKAFIGEVLDVEVGKRLFGTAAAVAAAVLGGAHIVRVHDLAEMRQVALVARAIRDGRLPAG